MRFKFFLSFTGYGLLPTLLIVGCQLIAPYKGPLTPTPDQWKNSYTAPDAGQPTIPSNWKDDLSSQPPSPPLKIIRI